MHLRKLRKVTFWDKNKKGTTLVYIQRSVGSSRNDAVKFNYHHCDTSADDGRADRPTTFFSLMVTRCNIRALEGTSHQPLVNKMGTDSHYRTSLSLPAAQLTHAFRKGCWVKMIRSRPPERPTALCIYTRLPRCFPTLWRISAFHRCVYRHVSFLLRCFPAY